MAADRSLPADRASDDGDASRLGSVTTMLGLVLAGEAVFMLPFHVARFFRPTMLAVFGLDATELGVLQSTYGIAALLAYLPSGLLADRLSARALLCAALGSTALGGLYLLTVPGFWGLAVLFAAWGVTTILPLWGALIRATRRWGGAHGQGRAYGLLEGGRGLLAAAVASFGALLLAALFPDDPTTISADERRDVLLQVIATYVGVTTVAALAVWCLVPAEPREHRPRPTAGAGAVADLRELSRLPALWVHAAIVLAAYVGYKGMDDLALFAVDGWGYDEVEAARLVAATTWLRPLVCVAAGALGDRLRATTVLPLAFVLVGLGELVLWWVPGGPGLAVVLAVDVLAIATGAFALRACYFALLVEAAIPLRVTGAAVGVVSVIGFLPELFVNALGGVLIDAAPGALGHQRFSAFLAGAAGLGLVASLAFARLVRAERRAAGPAAESLDAPSSRGPRASRRPRAGTRA